MKQSLLICTSVIFLLFFPPEKTLHAQLNRFGGGLCFSTGIDKPPVETGNPGLNLRGVYEINDNMFIIPALSFYVPKKASFTVFDLNTYYGQVDAWFGFRLANEKQIIPLSAVGKFFTA